MYKARVHYNIISDLLGIDGILYVPVQYRG